MSKPGFATGVCRNCKNEITAALHLCIDQNGSQKFTWICPQCSVKGCFFTGKPDGPQFFISHDVIRTKLTQEQIDCLPVIMFDPQNRCARCGDRDCELHHWAPKEIFGPKEAEDWPKDYLCPGCHTQYHATLKAWKEAKP